MNQSKLSRKLYLQWFVLKLCKDFPRTFNELYEAIQKDIILPPAAGGPKATKDEPMHSQALVRRYIKDLATASYLILVDEAYSITKTGHEMEITLRRSLKDRLKVVLQAVENMHLDLIGKINNRDVVLVAPGDREFLRGAISMKDIVRYFTLSRLARPHTEESVADLREDMLQTYGWTCSREYYYRLVRDELGDEQDKASEYDQEMDERLAHCVKGEWKGERRNKKYYRITPKGREWLEVFKEDATEDMVDAGKYLANLIRLLNE